MLDNLFKSFDGLLREKHSLTTKANQLAKSERKLVEKLSRALMGSGYRVVPMTGQARAAGKGRGRIKRLQCPKCERMFAHPLPMARHLKATHGVTTGSKKKTTRRKSA